MLRKDLFKFANLARRIGAILAGSFGPTGVELRNPNDPHQAARIEDAVWKRSMRRRKAQENYDRQKTLRRMADEGLLVTTSGGRRFTRQRRIKGGNRIWSVCIDNDAMVALLDRAMAPPAPSPSRGDAPSGDAGGDGR